MEQKDRRRLTGAGTPGSRRYVIDENDLFTSIEHRSINILRLFWD